MKREKKMVMSISDKKIGVRLQWQRLQKMKKEKNVVIAVVMMFMKIKERKKGGNDDVYKR